MTMLISTNLIQSAVSGAMLQLPQAKAPQWSENNLKRVEELLPFNSADEVGRILGRSGNAIKIIRLRRGIQASSKTDGWFTANQVRELLGMADGRPVIGWVKKGFVMGHQIKGDSTWMVNEVSLRRWVASPLSWVYFDPSRIADEKLARLVGLAQLRWDDEWLSTRQVADMKGTDTKVVLMAIKRGGLPGVHILEKDGRHENAAWGFWAVRRSDVEGWHFNAPAFDLMDDLHAFMLLARAIGLSGERISRYCGLSDATISKRMRMIDSMHLAPKLVRKHKRLQFVSTSVPVVCVHADWRKYADQFPYVQRAFERYMAGRAAMDDCYLITRILKVQLAATGIKVSTHNLGKCTPETVGKLIVKMRELGVTPYLPRRKRK